MAGHMRQAVALLTASLITFSPTTASALSLTAPNTPSASHRAPALQDNIELPQSFVSGPWRVTVVDAIQSPAIDGIDDDTAEGNEWVVVVADVANWSDEPSTLNLTDLTLDTGDSSANQPEQAVAIADVNLRAGPGTDTAILAAVLEGTSVTVQGAPENGFLPVEMAGQEGWVFAELLNVGGAVAANPSAVVADLSASQAASDILELNGGEEWPVQPGDVERVIWAFPVTAGAQDYAVALGGEALPLLPKQRQTLNPDALPPLTEAPSLVDVEAVEATGGRTLEIEENGQTTEVQLFGIDTPVQDECFAPESETRLQELVSDGISLEAVGDEYLAWRNGDPADAPALINHALVEEGLALANEADGQSSFDLWLGEADRQAQAADLGLWIECTGVHGTEKPEPTPTPGPTEPSADVRVDYPVLPDVRELTSRPENLFGEKIAFTGQILAITGAIPNSMLKLSNFVDVDDVTTLVDATHLQIYVNAPDGTVEPVLVVFDGDTSGMFEGAVVTVHGTVIGTRSGPDPMGEEITQPVVKADTIDFAQ